MKLNKVEKIIVAVILLGLILVGGTFLFIVPSYQQIEKNTKTLAANIAEQQELEERLARLDTIDDDIAKQKTDAKTYEGGFYPDLTTYEASEIAMALLKTYNLEAHSIGITNFATTNLTLEHFVPANVEYDLKTFAQSAKQQDEGSDTALLSGEFMDGKAKYSISASSPTDVTILDSNGEEVAPSKYSETMQKYYKAAVCAVAADNNTSQTVGVITATYEVTGKFGDYVKFIDHVYSLGRATKFDTVLYPMTITIKDEDEDALYSAEDGTLVTGKEAQGEETAVTDDTEVTETLSISFLSVEPMDALHTVQADDTEVVVDQRPAAY